MTMVGEKIFCPELVFPFETLFLVRKNKGKTEILFTLQKDKVENNIWTPVGGEKIFPSEGDSLSYFGGDAIREAKEEVGVEVELLWPIPFYMAFVPRTYTNYSADINLPDGSIIQRRGVYTSLNYFLGKIISGEPCCASQPDEPAYEIVDLVWLEIKEAIDEFEKGQKYKTYPTIIEGLRELQKFLDKTKKIIKF